MDNGINNPHAACKASENINQEGLKRENICHNNISFDTEEALEVIDYEHADIEVG